MKADKEYNNIMVNLIWCVENSEPSFLTMLANALRTNNRHLIEWMKKITGKTKSMWAGIGLTFPNNASRRSKKSLKNKMTNTMELPNDISKIAAIIQEDWKAINEDAAQHLKKMHRLHSIYDKYGKDSAKTVIRKFLNHAKYWHGETAREVKKKLNEMVQ